MDQIKMVSQFATNPIPKTYRSFCQFSANFAIVGVYPTANETRKTPMNTSTTLANRFREVILNGTWIANTNFKDQLTAVDWKQANTPVGALNTIALLTFHIHYYIAGILNVLEGGSLDIRDKYSFDMPPVQSPADWDALRNQLWSDAERFARRLEQLPESLWSDVFVDAKYGTYQRNIDGLIEHCYYHLGQVVLIRKMLTVIT